jgi:two-component system LytT family response regulator
MTTSPDSQPPVIFISTDGGYEVFALDARLFDSLSGPEERDQLIGALTEARSRGELGGNGDSEERRSSQADRPSGGQAQQRLLVRSPGRILLVPVNSIDWIGAEGNYVCLHVGGATHLMRETMTGVEGQLDPARFVRIHRSTIVNLDRIVEMKPACRGEYELVLQNGDALKLSRTYRAELERRIGDRL